MKIEEQFMFFFENMMDMVFLVEWKDNSLWYTKVNRSAQQKLGVEMVGRKLVDVLPQATFDHLNLHYLTCIRKKKSINYSDLNLFVPNMPAAETTLTPIEDGDKFYVLAVTKDVNELKKKAEDHLFLHSLVANTVDAMLVVDCSGKILKINEAFSTQFGWSEKEIINKSWKQINFTPEKLKPQTINTLLMLNEGESVPAIETIRLTKSGEEIHTSVSYSPILDEQKKIVALSMIYRNIQHLRELEYRLARSKEAYKSLFSYHKNAILIVNREGFIQKINEACEALTGYKETDIIGSNFIDYVKQQLPFDPLRHSFEGHVSGYELMVPHADSKILYFNVTHVPIIVNGQVTGVYVIAQDITEKKEMELALKNSEEKFRIITEHSSDLIKVVNVEGYISYASPSYRNIIGCDYEVMEGENLVFGLEEEDKHILQEAFQQLCTTDESIILEYRYRNKQRAEVWVEVNGTPIYKDGRLEQIILTGRIISERKQLQKQLTYQAYHDSLTGLPNRRLLEQEIEKAIANSKEQDGKLALLFLDCDNFKQINDTFGHGVGDELLVSFSKRLLYCVRSEDIVSRLGGDEFVILIKTVKSKEQILVVADRLQELLQKRHHINGHDIYATSSIGISIYPDNGTTTKQLFRVADQALYSVKKSGRNDYQLY